MWLSSCCFSSVVKEDEERSRRLMFLTFTKVRTESVCPSFLRCLRGRFMRIRSLSLELNCTMQERLWLKRERTCWDLKNPTLHQIFSKLRGCTLFPENPGAQSKVNAIGFRFPLDQKALAPSPKRIPQLLHLRPAMTIKPLQISVSVLIQILWKVRSRKSARW